MSTSSVQIGQSFMYLETTIPPGQTITDYRRSRPCNRRLLRRMYSRLPLRSRG